MKKAIVLLTSVVLILNVAVAASAYDWTFFGSVRMATFWNDQDAGKGHHFCGDCDDFPCDNFHPYADKAGTTPHNIKIVNLCLINKMGLEKWAKTKAADVREVCFTKPWTLE